MPAAQRFGARIRSRRRYNLIVARVLRTVVLLTFMSAGFVAAQEASEPPRDPAPPARTEEPAPPLPPEEDQAFATPKEYSFNPLQAKKELKIGRFYFKKGSFKAAALRAQEALKWDDSLLDAYLMLGEARERMQDTNGARKAYSQFLELARDNAKERKEIEKRLQSLAKADVPTKAQAGDETAPH